MEFGIETREFSTVYAAEVADEISFLHPVISTHLSSSSRKVFSAINHEKYETDFLSGGVIH